MNIITIIWILIDQLNYGETEMNISLMHTESLSNVVRFIAVFKPGPRLLVPQISRNAASRRRRTTWSKGKNLYNINSLHILITLKLTKAACIEAKILNRFCWHDAVVAGYSGFVWQSCGVLRPRRVILSSLLEL